MEWTPESIEHACRTMVPGYNPWNHRGEYTFDPAAALRIVAFFEECLCFTVGRWAGTPFLLQPWQAAIVGNLWGWRRPDGTRRYRKCLIYTARKSGKTELAAGIGNALLFIDGEPAPEIVTAAGNADQAARIFNAASTMVQHEPEMSGRSKVFRRAIECTANGGTMKVINAAAKTKHGGNLHAALIDELHVHPDAELVDVLETSMRARRQPLVVYTTTAGQNPESIAGEVYTYACGVRDGLILDDEFLPAVHECPKDGDIADPANWKRAQPNLGVTVAPEEYERELRKAREVTRYMHTFKQLSLNMWVESATAWIGLDDWKRCGETFDLDSLKGKRATIGIDLSSTTDTTACVAAIEDDDKLRIVPFIFLPKDNAEGRIKRQKRDRAPYLSWISQNHITATEGNTIDYDAVEAKVVELSNVLDVVEVQADPYNASGLLERLQKAGLIVTTVRQGWSLAEATKETERLILTRGLAHPDNPAFTWQVTGAAVTQDRHENCWLVKDKSTRRIDAAVAMVMAVNGLKFGLGRQAQSTKHYYEEHPELIVL
ncbi:MAG TPA: terminase TerL endonuclease subunit [Tepidisphaeraceae bacterium]|nr:terminase TerL endonuclease subunit [Tepidisphaeraceae bacterium]